MKASDYIARALEAQGVSRVFEVVGGTITQLVDSIYRRGTIALISVHHEQAAAFAAEGLSRMSGVPGVALATSGPGAINLMTGIGSCFFDSTPAVFITGQVNRHEQKGTRPIRQLGFQETDIVSMAAPVVKAAWRIECPEELPARLAAAFLLALSGRPGPVLLDIPMDVQGAEVDAQVPALQPRADAAAPDSTVLDEMLTALSRARRPLILAGGGVRGSRSVDLFRRLIEMLQVPVVNSLLGVDVLPYGHPLRVGMIGTYGNRWANLAVGRADFLLVLGSRLDIRQTGADTRAFKGERTIYHVDCDPGELNNRVTGCFPVLSDLRACVAALLVSAERLTLPMRQEWLAEIQALRQEWPDTAELRHIPGINPNQFMHQLARTSSEAMAFVADVGQHQMWAAQSLELDSHQRFLTSGGMGAMGSGLPAAVGAAFAQRGRPVVLIAGDGGFQLNIQELETVRHHRLPLKMVILNNRCHGMVRQFQESYFESRFPSTFWGYSAPDFVRVAQAYEIGSRRVDAPDQIAEGLSELWRDQEPFLLEVTVDTFANALPKIAFGRPLTEMEPFAKPLGLEGT